MSPALTRIAGGGIAAGGVVAAATVLSLMAGANAVTAGFVYLISVLAVTTWRGFLAGAIGSLLATGCFNYFFFAPVGTFRIADPQNWVSLACFLIATVIAGRLVSRERDRTAEAESRMREIEALYALCVDLFAAGTTPGGLDAATSRALRTIGAQGGGLILDEGGAGSAGGWIGNPADLEMHRLLRIDAAPPPEPRSARWRNARVPVAAGGRTFGELVAYGTRARQETLESVAKLLGLALERERLLSEQARLEALRASDSLKTALLQAVSHDLSTPITAALISLESLRRDVAGHPTALQTVELIVSETARLHRRIQNLLDMARLEAGAAHPRREPTPAADLFRAVRENLRHIASTRRIDAHVDPACPDLDVDPSLAIEILVNLVDNAHRASPPDAAVELTALPVAGEPPRVAVEVLDRGGGFSPGGVRRGLGLEIARSFAAAMGGAVTFHPREGGGVRARLELAACPLVEAPIGPET